MSYGEYELIEVKAPDGYVLAKDPIHFKVDGSLFLYGVTANDVQLDSVKK